MKIFKKAQPIVLGIYAESGWSKIKAEDFTLKLAYATSPLDEWEIKAKVIDDEPYWWCEPFLVFKEADYILHWINENEDINVKELFRVDGEYDLEDSDFIV